MVVTCVLKQKGESLPIRDATRISIEYIISMDFLGSSLISRCSVKTENGLHIENEASTLKNLPETGI